MGKQRLVKHTVVVMLALVLAALACTAPIGETKKLPSVTIISPKSGSDAPVGQPLRVDFQASDAEGGGIVQVDLQMDGRTVDSFSLDVPQASLGASLTCTPTEEGVVILTVTAYRQDGTASLPVTISLNARDGAASAADTDEEPEESPEPSPAEEEEIVEARTRQAVSVHGQPGEHCPVIGQIPRDEVIVLLKRTTSPSDTWYQTDYLGEAKPGWVYHDLLTLLSDDGDLPREPEQDCRYCGDGTCSSSAGETCKTCAADCGACPAASGACAAGPGKCCGDGVCQTDESPDWCGDCVVEPFCGDGTCDYPGETCESCVTDCGACPVAPGACAAGPGKCCGDGVCQTDESPNWCGDCVVGPFCGDGTCDYPGEDCDNCVEDCPVCVIESFCGDGTCDPGEDCNNCAKDCPICMLEPVCGDGYCDKALGETCCTCVADCPAVSTECLACSRP